MLLNPVPSKQYGKDFKKIVQSPKFNQIEYLVVLTKLLIGGLCQLNMEAIHSKVIMKAIAIVI
jgi:mRNA-degrading endonuclease YafQ of YafQ-DinJ toxin-antitoxin module